MKPLFPSLILGLAALTSHAASAPTQHPPRQATTLSLACTGATGSYQAEIALPSPENFYDFNITNPLSVSNCCVGGPGFCGLEGVVEGAIFTVNGGECVDVGPPQALRGGVCSTF